MFLLTFAGRGQAGSGGADARRGGPQRQRQHRGPSFSFFVLGLPHVILIELRLALISYQDYHMLLLTLAGRPT